MKNRWSDSEAKQFVRRYYKQCGRDLALRVYTSRLIGREPDLVMHGGGNTSVKTAWRNILGDSVQGLFVKGSGWNLDSIEPQGLPGLDLRYLLRLRELQKLSDEEMVNELRTHLFDASAPNPSVETLLHAFLPPKFVDHSHADAILALTNLRDGGAHVRAALGGRVGLVEYVPPGFELSKRAAQAFDADPALHGLVLMKHGFFTFGATAKESYDRHIQYVSRAERYLAKHAKGRVLTAGYRQGAVPPQRNAAIAAPIVRGLLAKRADTDAQFTRVVLDHRVNGGILAFVNSKQAKQLSQTPPLTPDHVIRTKELPLYVAKPDYTNPAKLRRQLEQAVAAFERDYARYFEHNVKTKRIKRVMLPPSPRVILLPGAGLFAAGPDRKEAAIAADLYEHTIRTKVKAAPLGRYHGLSRSQLFDMEYWSLEQAKLGKAKPKPLGGQAAVVTGAAGAIGAAICEGLLAAGAHVALWDINTDALAAVAAPLAAQYGRRSVATVRCDVTDAASVARAFEATALAFGGVDIVVPNAGIAYSAAIEAIDRKRLQRVMDVNFTGYFNVLQGALPIFKAQRTGGNVVINSSKNVFAPGKEFAAYSASKAAGHQLGKIAALEFAELGVRVNMINADAVFAHGAVPSGLWREVGPARARARGLAFSQLQEFYKGRNLLKTFVAGRHVANAVVFFAANQTPTTGATLPVDGGIPEAFPR